MYRGNKEMINSLFVPNLFCLMCYFGTGIMVSADEIRNPVLHLLSNLLYLHIQLAYLKLWWCLLSHPG